MPNSFYYRCWLLVIGWPLVLVCICWLVWRIF